MLKVLASTLVVMSLLTTLFGCGGTLSPLYADFRIDEPVTATDSTTTMAPDSVASTHTIQDAIADALTEVGWELDEAPSPNSVSTKEVEIIDWGLYDVRVSLDVVPINQKFVRVYVHPYRQYFYGSRSKMSYLNRRVRTYVFPELSQALRARGIVPIGEPKVSEQETDEEEGAPDDSQEAFSESRGVGTESS